MSSFNFSDAERLREAIAIGIRDGAQFVEQNKTDATSERIVELEAKIADIENCGINDMQHIIAEQKATLDKILKVARYNKVVFSSWLIDVIDS